MAEIQPDAMPQFDVKSRISGDYTGPGFGQVLNVSRVERQKAGALTAADFFTAIANGNVATVRRILADPPPGFDIDGPAPDEENALFFTLERGEPAARLEIVKLLVDHGRIDMARLNAEGKSVYDVAASYGGEPNRPNAKEIAEFLRERMTAELARAIRDGNETRAKALLEAGADPRGQFAEGLTFLAAVAAKTKPELVKAILARIPQAERADFVNLPGVAGNTALHEAAYAKDRRAYDMLVEAGGDEKLPNAEGETPAGLWETLVKRDEPSKGRSLILDWLDILFFAGYHYERAHRARPVHTNLPGPSTTQVAPTDLPSATPTSSPQRLTPDQQLEADALVYLRRIEARLGRRVSFAFGVNEHGQRQVQLDNIGIFGMHRRRPWSQEQQADYILDRVANLATWARYPTGRWLLNSLLDGEVPLFVSPHASADDTVAETQSSPDEIWIFFEHAGIPGGGNWGTPENSPADVVFLHEGLHARRRMRRIAVDSTINAQGIDVPTEEPFVGGYGPGAFPAEGEGNENTYRDESGLPNREWYGTRSELGFDGGWAGIRANSEREWWILYHEQQARRGRPHRHGPRDAPEMLGESLAAGYELVASSADYDALLSDDPDLVTRFSSDEEFGGKIIRFHQERPNGEMVGKGVIDGEATPDLYRRAELEREALTGMSTNPARGLVDIYVKPGWAPYLVNAASKEMKARLERASHPLPQDIDDLRRAIIGGAWSEAEVRRLRDSGLLASSPALTEALETYLFNLWKPSKQDYEDNLNALAVGVKDKVGKPGREFMVPAVEGDLVPFYEKVATYVYDHLPEFAKNSKKTRGLSDEEVYRFADIVMKEVIPGLVRDRVINAYRRSFFGYEVAHALHDTLKSDAEKYGWALHQIILTIVKRREGR
jgi:hypothetical protein